MRQTLLLAIVLAAAGCGRIESFRDSLFRTPAYDRYVASLRRSGIDRTALGAAWIAAGERALEVQQIIAIPSGRVERFHFDDPAAVAYRVELHRGQVYRLELEREAGTAINLFVDLFQLAEGHAPQRVSSAGPPARQLSFEPDEDGTFIVRIQAQLVSDGTVRIAHGRGAALLFPIPGAGRRNIHSLFGASRSGGRREHQGIDIFSPRGTPVVAAVDGWISSTSPNQLGGNVVWLWDPARGQTLYYAHLDRHAVSGGQRVRKGDVIGYVGNTGNARSTAPHLHFGIYRRGLGAIDPLYYVIDRPS